MKLCVNCENFEVHTQQCIAPELRVGDDPVWGGWQLRVESARNCRTCIGDTYCGPNAHWFVPIMPTRREEDRQSLPARLWRWLRRGK